MSVSTPLIDSIAGPPESPEQVLFVELPNANAAALWPWIESVTLRFVPVPPCVDPEVMPYPTARNDLPVAYADSFVDESQASGVGAVPPLCTWIAPSMRIATSLNGAPVLSLPYPGLG